MIISLDSSGDESEPILKAKCNGLTSLLDEPKSECSRPDGKFDSLVVEIHEDVMLPV